MTIKAAVLSHDKTEERPEDWRVVRRWLFLEVLASVNGNQVRAARALGCNRSTLRRVLASVNIEVELAIIRNRKTNEAERLAYLAELDS